MLLNYEQARALLQENEQIHILDFWQELDSVQCQSLLAQIAALDFSQIRRMRQLLKTGPRREAEEEIEPAPVVSLSGSARTAATERGEQALRANQVAVLLVAGGQGSRLGFAGPTCCFPIGPLTGAPLFFFHSRKIVALERRYGCRIPFYIMTSEANDEPTRNFFERNNYFGLSRERTFFFMQGMWPALWPDGRIVMEAPDRIFTSPDGHGGVLSALDRSGMLADMEQRGITTVFYFQVDNPLVEIAGPAFVGLHLLRDGDVSIKVCPKRDAYESLGVFVLRKGKPAVVEYTELTEQQKTERNSEGLLRFRFGSVAIHVFSLAFLRQQTRKSLPLHVAHKKVPCCGPDGRTVQPTKPNAYKFEKFIFDVIPDAERVIALEFNREDEFSPVKNAEGEDSPQTAQRDMIRKWARWLESSGIIVPRTPSGEPKYKIEIDPCYANSAEELKERGSELGPLRGDLLLQA
ncbi:MAG: UTP--glucose-1-phosphate uridylyltransferase [Kiritimatiellia bacterium]